MNYLGCLVCKCTYKASMALNYSFGMKEENILRLILIIFWICLEFMLVSCIRTVNAGACLWLGQGNGDRLCWPAWCERITDECVLISADHHINALSSAQSQSVQLEKCRTFTAEILLWDLLLFYAPLLFAAVTAASSGQMLHCIYSSFRYSLVDDWRWYRYLNSSY